MSSVEQPQPARRSFNRRGFFSGALHTAAGIGFIRLASCELAPRRAEAEVRHEIFKNKEVTSFDVSVFCGWADYEGRVLAV